MDPSVRGTGRFNVTWKKGRSLNDCLCPTAVPCFQIVYYTIGICRLWVSSPCRTNTARLLTGLGVLFINQLTIKETYLCRRKTYGVKYTFFRVQKGFLLSGYHLLVLTQRLMYTMKKSCILCDITSQNKICLVGV